jgi:hypothetical protein
MDILQEYKERIHIAPQVVDNFYFGIGEVCQYLAPDDPGPLLRNRNKKFIIDGDVQDCGGKLLP